MKTKLSLMMIAFIAICFSAVAQHKPRTQKQRVVQGVKSGEITKAEAAKIHEERKDVKQEVKEAKADGIVTTAEKKDIKEERKEANKAIIRAKHNNRTRH